LPIRFPGIFSRSFFCQSALRNRCRPAVRGILSGGTIFRRQPRALDRLFCGLARTVSRRTTGGSGLHHCCDRRSLDRPVLPTCFQRIRCSRTSGAMNHHAIARLTTVATRRLGRLFSNSARPACVAACHSGRARLAAATQRSNICQVSRALCAQRPAPSRD